MTRRALAGLALAVALALIAPAAGYAAAPVDSVPMPPKRKLSYYWDAFEQGVARPAARTVDPARWARRISGAEREAENVDAQDRVRLPSTWWQPRVGWKTVTPSDMLAGPGSGKGPAPGPWKIVSAKKEGASRGFQMVDAAGARFAIKFDPTSEPELASGADVAASKLFWAAGYNVPDNAVAWFRREDLTIDPKAAKKDPSLTAAMIDDLLRGESPDTDGRYRVVASRFIKGEPIGEWLFSGRDDDDPEDRIPHELRREIRGLWAICAWLNHTDASARNTLDMYVKDGGRSFTRHYLIDFSGCLGSASVARQPLRSGHEYIVDYGAMAKNFVSLGLRKAEWERSVEPQLRGVGFIDAATFDPEGWRPYLPNPAFDECTERDARWGARIVAAFPDDLIRAAVESAAYSDPRATDYLVRILRERRDKIAARWLTPEELERAIALRGANDGTSGGIEHADRDVRNSAPEFDWAPRAMAAESVAVSPAADAATGDSLTSALPPADAPPAPRQRSLPARLGRTVGNFFSDAWYMVRSPFRMKRDTWIGLGLVAAVEVALYASDQEILDAVGRNRNEPVMDEFFDLGDRIEPVGYMGNTNPYYMGGLVAGHLFGLEVLKQVPAEILESHFLAGGLRNVTKYVVGRRHPYEREGARVYEFGHGTSFPSGHTSVMFELATITSMHVDRWPYTALAYTLATAGSAQRVESLNHWPSDVFISAVYGTVIARMVVRRNRERRERDAAEGFALAPWMDEGRVAGLAVTRRF